MTAQQILHFFLALLVLFIQNDFSCDALVENQSRVAHYCESYNRTTCNTSRAEGHEEGCSITIKECSPNYCYSVWNEENGNTSVVLKGCFLPNDECNNTRCVENKEDPPKGYLFCCCMGNMCNKNFTWDPIPKVVKSGNNVSEPMPHSNASSMFHIIISITVPMIVIGGIFVFWLYKRNKHMFNELPTMEQNPLPPPSPFLGSRPIQLIEVKARGRFGAVWRAQFKSEEVAVKIFPIQDKQSWVQEQEIFKLPNMDHPNILHYIGVEKRGDNLQAEFWLITAYHEKGSLCDYLKAHTLTWPVLCRVVETMARGLMHLHEEIPSRHGEPLKPAIAHRDFKSKNVLLKNDMTACIADFGLALVFESGKSCGDTHGQVGTRRYMAPEVLEGAINFTPDAFLRIDMYACGLVLWELVSRCIVQGEPIPEYRLPFEEEVGHHPSLEDMQEAVVQRKVRPAIPEAWRSHPGLTSLCETMEECWDHDAEARLSASCVMERVLNQSKYQHSTLSMRIETEAPRSPLKENSM